MQRKSRSIDECRARIDEERKRLTASQLSERRMISLGTACLGALLSGDDAASEPPELERLGGLSVRGDQSAFRAAVGNPYESIHVRTRRDGDGRASVIVEGTLPSGEPINLTRRILSGYDYGPQLVLDPPAARALEAQLARLARLAAPNGRVDE